MPSAGGVSAARSTGRWAGSGAIPAPALHYIRVAPLPLVTAKTLLIRHHYLHSLPGGTQLAFGVFADTRLLGALTLGVGPANAYRLVRGARPPDCLALTRFWHDDELPHNSESRVLGFTVRSLRRHTNVKFLVSYADPAAGHIGIIYQASNWLYTGRSSTMPLYDIGDGRLHHSRSLAHALGTHSVRYLAGRGVDVKAVPQTPKHRYLYFVDSRWRDRLAVPALPYPKQEESDARG